MVAVDLLDLRGPCSSQAEAVRPLHAHLRRVDTHGRAGRVQDLGVVDRHLADVGGDLLLLGVVADLLLEVLRLHLLLLLFLPLLLVPPLLLHELLEKPLVPELCGGLQLIALPLLVGVHLLPAPHLVRVLAAGEQLLLALALLLLDLLLLLPPALVLDLDLLVNGVHRVLERQQALRVVLELALPDLLRLRLPHLVLLVRLPQALHGAALVLPGLRLCTFGLLRARPGRIL
mmetsp:Transcript_34235/g.107444  ORF Transcript_34235/g.107444 Transcript_34235/m.107444 type:complete len:231 (+) Transcript_34235:3509-4201(+)